MAFKGKLKKLKKFEKWNEEENLLEIRKRKQIEWFSLWKKKNKSKIRTKREKKEIIQKENLIK